jgi:DNA polymerase-1
MVFALEGNGTKQRRKIFAEYKKGTRTSQGRPEAFDLLAFEILRCIECITIKASKGEADDAIAGYVKRNVDAMTTMLIVTEDRDLYQLVRDPNIKILTRSGKVLNEAGAFSYLKGIHPSEVLFYKCFMGDKSDNIPKVPGLGRKAALATIQGSRSLKHCFKKAAESNVLKQRHKTAIEENKKLVKRNRKLVALRDDLPLVTRRHKPKPKRLARLLGDNQIWTWSKSDLTKLTKQGSIS